MAALVPERNLPVADLNYMEKMLKDPKCSFSPGTGLTHRIKDPCRYHFGALVDLMVRPQ